MGKLTYKGEALHNGFVDCLTLLKLKEVDVDVDWNDVFKSLENELDDDIKKNIDISVAYAFKLINEIENIEKGTGVEYCLNSKIKKYEKEKFFFKFAISLLVSKIKSLNEQLVNQTQQEEYFDDPLLDLFNKRFSGN